MAGLAGSQTLPDGSVKPGGCCEKVRAKDLIVKLKTRNNCQKYPPRCWWQVVRGQQLYVEKEGNSSSETRRTWQ